MKTVHSGQKSGFTLVELLVVIAIMGIMVSLAGSVLRGVGKGRSLDSGVELLESMIREAQATAVGNNTYTRLVIANSPKETTSRSPHLRLMMVQIFRKDDNAQPTDVAPKGRWVSTSAGMMLPPGVYFSPHYSTPLEWMEGSTSELIGQDTARLSGKGEVRVFYVLFDDKGRFVAPVADPLTPTRALRLVLINAKPGKGRKAHDGIVPLETDMSKRPVGAKGIVLWPRGDTSRLRTTEQVFGK